MNEWRLFQLQRINTLSKCVQKLNDPLTAPKTYWNIINRF